MRKYWRHSIATAVTVILSTACQVDDPVALNSEHPSSLDEALPMETAASSSGGSSGVTLIEPTRPRFRIDVSSSNALTPGATITVRLQGEAVEKIAGGTVSVRLPTMASMDHAGADNRPYYPAGQSLPVVRKWTLSAMNRGDTWYQSFTVALPSEKGYYDLVVDADINAPAGAFTDPFVDDEVQFERWMLVTDAGGGGSMALGFNESLFADNIAPVPGPFRVKASRRGTTGQTASAGVGMDSDNEVTLSLKYPGTSGQGLIAAVGVEVRGDMYNGQGQHVAAYSRIVGTSSKVSFPCPTGSGWIQGSAILPSTVDIHQHNFIAYWDADADDCGETFNATGPRHFYMPWKRLKEVAGPVRSHFGVATFAKVHWTTNLSNEKSSYDANAHRITFGSQSYAHKWTVAHEFAHAMHEKRMNGLWRVEQPACQTHEIWEASGYRCALLEGFADYAASIGSGWPPNFENPPSDAKEGPDVEGRVAAMFHDLIDSSNGTGDATTYSSSSIGTAFKTCEVRHGGGGWNYRFDVSHFVWCLENRIDTSVHSDYFTTTAPSAQRATRGSGWSADDTRTTWTHNLSS